MRRGLVFGAGLALAALAGCSPPKSDSGPARDVAYYRDHPVDRVAKMTACRGDPGRLAATPNCANALAADGEAVSKKFWTTPKAAPRVAYPSKL